MELYLGLPTLPSSKAATETLNGEQNGGWRIKTIPDTEDMTYDFSLPDRRCPSSKELTDRAGCWNVQILYQTGNIAGKVVTETEKVVTETERYQIEIFGIHESRWTGNSSEQFVWGHQKPYYERTDEYHSWEVAISTTK